jgi:hypothetical protein
MYFKNIKFRTFYFSVTVTIIISGLLMHGEFYFISWFITSMMSILLIFYRHEVQNELIEEISTHVSLKNEYETMLDNL